METAIQMTVEQYLRELAAVPSTVPSKKFSSVAKAAEEKTCPKEIADFGHKIGGARKDLYAAFKTRELKALSDMEIESARLSVLWPAESIKSLREKGKTDEVIYLTHLVRGAFKPQPTKSFHKYDSRHKGLYGSALTRYRYEIYISAVLAAKEECDQLVTLERDTSGLINLLQKWDNSDESVVVLKDFEITEVRKKDGRNLKVRIGYQMANHLISLIEDPQALMELADKEVFFGTKAEKDFQKFATKKANDLKKALNRFAAVEVLKEEGEQGKPFTFKSGSNYIVALFPYRYTVTCCSDTNLTPGTWVVFDRENYCVLPFVATGIESGVKAYEWICAEGISLVSANGGRKKTFREQELEVLVQEGFKKVKNVTGDDYIKAFAFYGGEFGNWLAHGERQANLDLGFNAFENLARALGIGNETVSLGGKLSIAFGSRGKGGANAALAHYESGFNVINLTKMKGAGSLAHEWGHAFDHYIAKVERLSDKFATERYGWSDTSSEIGLAVKKVVETMRKDAYGVSTRFLSDSVAFDKLYAKTDNGYWKSEIEMFARAFACYVEDKLAEQGIRDDYLCGHAESCVSEANGKTLYAYPRGEERKRINAALDELVRVVFAE